jgi:hypothetical protein
MPRSVNTAHIHMVQKPKSKTNINNETQRMPKIKYVYRRFGRKICLHLQDRKITCYLEKDDWDTREPIGVRVNMSEAILRAALHE